MGRSIANTLLLGMLASLFAGCGTPGAKGPSLAGIPDVVPGAEPPSSTGNPESYVVFGKRYFVRGSSEGYLERGVASWYGEDFHGKRTSSGPPFDMYSMTAAHKSLPIPTYVRVRHLHNGRTVVVKVNDRGPFVGDRIIDLSYAAAAKLDMIGTGTAEVEVTALAPYQYLPGFAPADPNRALARAPQAGEPAVAPARPAFLRAAPQPPDAPPVAPQPPQPEFLRAAPPSSQPRLVATAYEPPPPTLARSAPPSPSPQPTPGDVARRAGAHRETMQSADFALAAQGGPPLYLQVGAFADLRNAEQLQSRLASHLRQAIRIDSGAGHLYKVRVGPLSTVAEADLLTMRLAALGINRPHVVFD